jgi:hypothetical protein
LSYFSRKLLVIPLVLALLLSYYYLSELWDPGINSSIWHEDKFYLPQYYAAMTFGICAPIVGALIFRHRSRGNTR